MAKRSLHILLGFTLAAGLSLTGLETPGLSYLEAQVTAVVQTQQRSIERLEALCQRPEVQAPEAVVEASDEVFDKIAESLD